MNRRVFCPEGEAEGTAGLCCQQDFVFSGRSHEEKKTGSFLAGKT